MANDARQHRVYVKQTWAADWDFIDQLWADSVTFCCSPEMPEAVLYWNYGELKPYWAVTYFDVAKVDYSNYFVKIEIDQDGARAAEQGRWTALWRGADGETAMAGTYLAVWRKVSGQWVIEAELYVTLTESR